MGRALQARGTTQIAGPKVLPLTGIQQFPAGNEAKRGCHTCRFPGGKRGSGPGSKVIGQLLGRMLAATAYSL